MFKSIVRALAFTSNWTSGVLRQPTMVLWMIAGPFLILFLFGLGANVQEPPPRTIVVTQGQSTEQPFDISQQDLSQYLTVSEVTDNLNYAMGELQAERTRLVLLLPPRPYDTVRSGKHAVIQVFVNEINPIRLAFIRIDIRAQMNVINTTVQEHVIDNSRDQINQADNQLSQVEQTLRAAGISSENITAAKQIIDTIRSIPSTVLAEPFQAQVQNIAPIEPTVITYFTPAALALIIQHLAVTLAALSMVRIRLLGTIELWQTAPVRLGEIIIGNYFSYGVLTLIISAILIIAVTWALGIPILGSTILFWTSIVLVVFASLAYGFIISLIAKNEQTAAQMAMIILLASIFLGGFVVPLEQITYPVRAISNVLPATYEAQILQSVMVRGEQGDASYYFALAIMAVLGLIVSAWFLSCELKPS